MLKVDEVSKLLESLGFDPIYDEEGLMFSFRAKEEDRMEGGVMMIPDDDEPGLDCRFFLGQYSELKGKARQNLFDFIMRVNWEIDIGKMIFDHELGVLHYQIFFWGQLESIDANDFEGGMIIATSLARILEVTVDEIVNEGVTGQVALDRFLSLIEECYCNEECEEDCECSEAQEVKVSKKNTKAKATKASPSKASSVKEKSSPKGKKAAKPEQSKKKSSKK